ncbi:MAG: hypothetical protein GYA16_02225 [Spirochaetes bacterium]|nr:hypothetical protein [Spirochaetota bacterium]
MGVTEKMDENAALKRLVLVKRLYLEGIEKAKRKNNYVDQMLSAINLFLAVETLMGAVVLSVDEQPDEVLGTKGYAGKPPSLEYVRDFNLDSNNTFEQLYNQVVAILRKEKLGVDERLFKWEKINKVRRARNSAQHKAEAPHPNDLPELIETTYKFIDRILSLHFSCLAASTMAISQAKLLDDSVLRQYIENAEKAMTQEKYKTCALLVRIAFLLGRWKRRFNYWKDDGEQNIKDDYNMALKISRLYRDKFLGSKDSILCDHVIAEVIKLPQLFDNWILGLDAVDRGRLDELTPKLNHYQNEIAYDCPPDEVMIIPILKEEIEGKDKLKDIDFRHVPTKDDCYWLLDYVTDTLLRWQQEERKKYSAVDNEYLAALPILEQI